MKIEIWSDIMCPFCYIGKRRFEAALEETFRDGRHKKLLLQHGSDEEGQGCSVNGNCS